MANAHGTKRPDDRTGTGTFQSSAEPTRPGEGVMGAITETASGMVDKARDVATGVAERARDVASDVGGRISGAGGSVTDGMKSVAGTIREHTPQSGVLHGAGAAVADSLESSARYLDEEGLRGIGEDLTNLVRRNPIPALFVGIGIGFLLARATSNRS